jgi:hypothetical protein
MKTIATTILSAALAAFVSAADEAKDTSVKLEGSATCAKCDLGKEKDCTSVLQVKEGGKTTTYYLSGKADKEWHKNICKSAKDVKMTGTVGTKDGKKTFDVTEIEMVSK